MGIPEVFFLQRQLTIRQVLNKMTLLKKILPYFLIAGQVLIFFQIERQEVQVMMLAFIAAQIWRRYKNSAVSTDSL